jgi:hypothetical protein
VRLRVDAAAEELALDVRVPVVFDLVVRPAGQLPRDQRPPARSRARSITRPSRRTRAKQDRPCGGGGGEMKK